MTMKRSRRPSSTPLVEMARAALYRWSRPYCKRLANRVLPLLETLEFRAAPVSVFVPTALLGTAAIAQVAEHANQTPAIKKPSSLADAFQAPPSDQDGALADLVFSHPAMQNTSSLETYRSLVGTNTFSPEEDAAGQQRTMETSFDPFTSAANMLADPLSNPASSPQAASGTHNATAPSGSTPNRQCRQSRRCLCRVGSGAGWCLHALRGRWRRRFV